jgi:bifunctional non-homologous end joining protein LigD
MSAMSVAFVPPMLPTLVDEPPMGSGWVHEIKHDGYRTLLLIDGGRARALSRQGRDWTLDFPGVCAAAAVLKCSSAIIDGETVVLDAGGRSDYGELRRAIHRRQPLVFFGFDLLHLDGEDLRRRPLGERRARLAGMLDRRGPVLQFSETFDGDGAAFFAAAARMELEGIISKRLDSRYASGRTQHWLKVKCFDEGAFILLGTEVKKSGPPAAHLARIEGGKLAYAGKAMISLTAENRARLSEEMAALEIEKPACPELRRERGARWVKPQLVVGVKHLKGTGGLRHATLSAVHRNASRRCPVTPSQCRRANVSREGKQSDEGPRRVGERQGLQTGESRDGQDRNEPYEPVSEGAKKAFDRGDYGPQPAPAEQPSKGLRKGTG